MEIETALATMALFRGASPGMRLISAYAEKLVGRFETQDALLAIEKFAELPREKGDPAFPELGLLIEMCGVAEVARKNRSKYGTAEGDRTVLARWQCPECRVTCAGYITPDDSAPRRCQGIPQDGSTAVDARGRRVCGAVMDQIHREAA